MVSKFREFPTMALIAVLSSWIFASCSAFVVKTGYRNLDWLAYREVDGFFDLNDEQEAFVKREFASILEWHKANELPKYRELLEDLKELVNQNELTREDVMAFRGRLLEIRDEYVEILKPVSIRLLESLESKQIEHLRGVFKEKNEEDFEELDVSEQEYYEERLENQIESMEDYAGDLTPVQTRLAEDYVADTFELSKMGFRQREFNQAFFLEILEKRSVPGQVEAELRNWMRNPGLLREPGYDELIRARAEKYYLFLEAFHASLTPEQKKHFNEEADLFIGYIDEIIQS